MMKRFLVAGLTALFLSPSLSHADIKPGVTFSWDKIPKFTYKSAVINRHKPAYNAARKRILEAGEAGIDMPCSSQILREAGWLMKYTTDHAAIEKRLADLKQSLDLPADVQNRAAHQTPTDGSWGECYENWFFRAWASVDPLKATAWRGERPKHRLDFLDEVNTAEKLVAKVRGARTSYVSKDGVNRRKELNLLVTAMGQLLFFPELAPLLPDDYPRDEVASGLITFMDEEWQDPETGFWGAWYDEEDGLHKTEDLSITFHIVSYRNGNVPRRQQMIASLFENRERKYPYGWQDRGTQNTHHNYDVARMLHLFWDDLDFIQRARAQAELAIMTSRVTRVSLRDDGLFDATPFGSIGEAQYFGVSFLKEVGYFDPKKNFWLNGVDFDPGGKTRKLLTANVKKLDPNDWWAVMTLKKLEDG